MTTWRGVRKEIVGAWRSVQYDLTRARSRRKDGEETTELIFPEHARPPRRLLATSGFALVSLVGAVATYFAVVNGLGALLSTGPAGEEAPASVVAGADGTGQRPPEARPDRTVRIARQGGPLTVAGRRAATGGASSGGTRDGLPTGSGPAADPVRPPGAPVPEDSDAPEPPAPTGTPGPTAPPTQEPSESPTPSPTASPSAGDEDTAEPTDDATGERRRHHRHHRRDQDETP